MKRPVFERFSTGLFIGTEATLALAWCIDTEVSTTFRSNLVEIFGISSALFAAVLALMGVQRQINVHQEQAEDNRQRDLKASIAVLPLVLSNFHTVCEQCFEVSLEEEIVLRDPSLRNQHIRLSEIDQSAISILQSCIRFSDQISAEWLSVVLRQFQLCKSRFASLVEGPHMLLEINRTGMAKDWLILRAMINHCYQYSRGEVQTIPMILEPESLSLHIGSRWYLYPIFEQVRQRIDATRDSVGNWNASDWFGV